MEKFTYTKVYTADDYSRSMGFYVSRGVLIDKMKDAFGKYWEKEPIQEATLVSLPDSTTQPGKVMKVSAYLLSESERDYYYVSMWYTPEAYAVFKADGLQRSLDKIPELQGRVCGRDYDFDVDYAEIHWDKYPEPKFPMEVVIESDNKDGEQRFFARINTHPNLDGIKSSGKMFFPDRSWVEKGVHVGPAKVKVKFEKPTFGIMLGENMDPKLPTFEELKVYLKAQDIPGTVLIIKQIFPSLGEVYKRSSAKAAGYELFVVTHTADGKRQVATTVDTLNYEEPLEYVWGKEVNDILLEDAFGGDFDLDDFLQNHFHACNYIYAGNIAGARMNTGNRRRMNASWDLEEERSFANPSLDLAVKEGIFVPHTLHGYGIGCLNLNRGKVGKLATFGLDVAVQVFQAVSEYNEKADLEILAKLRKGSITFME